MGAFDDINLERTELWNTPPPRSGRLRAIIAGVIVIGLIGAGLAWWIRTRPSPSAAIERMASSVTPAPRPAPAAVKPPRTELPPLDELDPMFSSLVGEVTASPAHRLAHAPSDGSAAISSGRSPGAARGHQP